MKTDGRLFSTILRTNVLCQWCLRALYKETDPEKKAHIPMNLYRFMSRDLIFAQLNALASVCTKVRFALYSHDYLTYNPKPIAKHELYAKP